jgi:hypothetical protein
MVLAERDTLQNGRPGNESRRCEAVVLREAGYPHHGRTSRQPVRPEAVILRQGAGAEYRCSGCQAQRFERSGQCDRRLAANWRARCEAVRPEAVILRYCRRLQPQADRRKEMSALAAQPFIYRLRNASSVVSVSAI